MIEHIHLQNFKASRNLNVRLAPLTLLSGLNSSGKSSILQSIALLRQSYGIASNPTSLMLRGDLVKLGHGRDVLNEGADTEGDLVTFEMRENGTLYRWSCTSLADASELPFSESPPDLPQFIHSPQFQYLQADRTSPLTLYPQAPQQAHLTGFLGIKGEYTADILAKSESPLSEKRSVAFSSWPLASELLQQVAPTPKLRDRVAAWLQHFSPGVRLTAERIKGTDDVQLCYEFVGHSRRMKSNPYRPGNVGFGLTYSLPIVVACLASPQGSLLLIENPEAHIHPQGQLALGELLALAAADGIQLIVETHSDHILNGIRWPLRLFRVMQSDGKCEKERDGNESMGRVVGHSSPLASGWHGG